MRASRRNAPKVIPPACIALKTVSSFSVRASSILAWTACCREEVAIGQKMRERRKAMNTQVEIDKQLTVSGRRYLVGRTSLILHASLFSDHCILYHKVTHLERRSKLGTSR